MSILYPEIETLSRDDIKACQFEKLNRMLDYASKTPFYKDRLPSKIKSFSDFQKIPFLSKNDLRDAFPYGLLSCPKENIVRVSASSGTTGIPTFSYCSKNDLNDFTRNEMLHFSHTGLSSADTIQCMTAFNLFTAGWGCYQGSIGLGATIIPCGPGNTQRQISLLKQLKPNYSFSNPSYLQYLLEVMTKDDFDNIELKVAITGGEVLTKEFQNLAKKKYNIEVYNFYGMTEFATHIGSECNYHDGLHINEDYLYAEIIDPDTGLVVPDGEYGELVLTNLKREAMPLIRYRTRDITRFIPQQCACGRTHIRMESITHRIDDMLIINGVNIFPSQIEECIYKNLDTATNYLIRISNNKSLKKMQIDIEIPKELLDNKMQLKVLEQNLIKSLKAYISITPKLKFVSCGTIPEIQGKTSKVIIE